MSLEERETVFCMTGDNHKVFHVFTDDPYWIDRLDKIATATGTLGAGKCYELSASMLSVKRERKPMSEERKAQLTEQLRKARNQAD